MLLVTREEYNAKVQDMQEFCIAAGLEYRVQGNSTLSQADFQVYYDGKWHGLGVERPPFSTESHRLYDDAKDAGIRFRVARDISLVWKYGLQSQGAGK